MAPRRRSHPDRASASFATKSSTVGSCCTLVLWRDPPRWCGCPGNPPYGLTARKNCWHGNAYASKRHLPLLSAKVPSRPLIERSQAARIPKTCTRIEFSAGRAEDLHREVAALERAEARLAAGTFGLSIESGEPIPDGRLAAVPTAERIVEEQKRYQRQ